MLMGVEHICLMNKFTNTQDKLFISIIIIYIKINVSYFSVHSFV